MAKRIALGPELVTDVTIDRFFLGIRVTVFSICWGAARLLFK